MTNLLPSVTILASGDHGYLYGLLFLIVSLAIGAASKHIQKVIPALKIIPFTVFLLIIGLVMGGLNRKWVEENKRGGKEVGAHGEHGQVEKSLSDPHSKHAGAAKHSPQSKQDIDHHGHHGPEGEPAPEFTPDVKEFIDSYRKHLIQKNPQSNASTISDKALLIHLGKQLESKNAWEKFLVKYPGLRDAYLKATTPTPTPRPAIPRLASEPVHSTVRTIPTIPEHGGATGLGNVPSPQTHSGLTEVKEPSTSHKPHAEGHEHGGHHEEKEGIIDYLRQAIYWGSQMDPHLILYVFLPILIFEAAFALDMHTFKKSVANAFWMAGPGIVTATIMTGALLWLCLPVDAFGLHAWREFSFGEVEAKHMAWFLCMLFGGIASATDPVAVVALLKELGASKKLGTLIEGESLLNDGTAIVAFIILFNVITGVEVFSPAGVAFGFLKIGAAGAVVGVLIGLVTAAWVKRVFNDPEIEIAVILVGSYLTFYAAETFLGVSGVLGLVALGVVMASFGRTRISPEVEHFLHEFIEFAAFISNVLIFLIVGVVISQNIVFENWKADLLMLGIIYLIIHVVRAANMLLYYPIMIRCGYGLPAKDAVVVWWGALRGAIGLALALVVASDTLHNGATNPIPQLIRDQFLFHISGIVLLTLLVNATTIKALVNFLGLTKIPAVKALMMGQAAQLVEAGAKKEMNLMKNDRFLGGASWARVRPYLPEIEVPDVSPEDKANIDTLAEARRRLLEKEKANYWNQFGEGLLSAQAVNALSGNISEILDLNGSVPLSHRPYLKNLCGTPSFYGIPLEFLENLPILGGNFSERLAAGYDSAKAFVMAQESVKKLVDSLALGIDDEIKDAEIRQTLKDEIDENRITGLSYIKDLQEKFPEVTVSIETKDAIRSLLNYERSTVKKMKKQGTIEADEANRLLEDVEKRMKEIADKQLKVKIPTSEEVLREVTWLQGMPEEIISKIVSASEEKNYTSGQELMKKGDPGDGLVVITQGSVKISIGGHVVDILGRGSVIGEMAVLSGVPRTADAIADTPVSARWLSTDNMQAVMIESDELTQSLWTTAGARFAENMLSAKEQYADWSQLELRRFIAQGKVVTYKEDTRQDLYGKVAILISGSASVGEGVAMNAPAHLEGAAAKINKGARVFMISAV